MEHTVNLTELAIVVVTALGFGIILERLRQPAVIGYIVAGLLLGPSIFGLVKNQAAVSALAEMGVLTLLFLIGLELSLQTFKKVWKVALTCTLVQLMGTLAAVVLLNIFFKHSIGYCILLACAIALSSTAVAIKMLESIGELHSDAGRLTIGILIAQDLAVVPIILILRSLGGASIDHWLFIKLVASIVFLVGLIIVLSRREKINLPFEPILENNKDLIPLVCVGFCFGMAAVSGLIGLSAAYGAFLAGLILGSTTARHNLLIASKPIESILVMVFFLSIGLLIDLKYIFFNGFKILILLGVLTLGKSLLNIAILRILKEPASRAFLSGLVLAQIGEFAFLLTSVGLDADLITRDDQKLIISLAALSLTLSPLWLRGARRLHQLRPKPTVTLRTLMLRVYSREVMFINRGFKYLQSKCLPQKKSDPLESHDDAKL